MPHNAIWVFTVRKNTRYGVFSLLMVTVHRKNNMLFFFTIRSSYDAYFLFVSETSKNNNKKMKIPTLSVLSVFALLGMALAMGGYGYGSYGASYMPVPVHYGSGYGQGGLGEGGLCKYK